MTYLLAFLPSVLALLTQRPFMNPLCPKFYLLRGLVRGPLNLTSTHFSAIIVCCLFYHSVCGRGDVSIWLAGKIPSSFLWGSLCGPLSPCEASSQAHLAPGYFSAMICLGSVLCLVLLAFNSNVNFLRKVFTSYRVQIKMSVANDTTPPFKRNAQDCNKAGSTWPLIWGLTLGKLFTSHECSVSSSGA